MNVEQHKVASSKGCDSLKSAMLVASPIHSKHRLEVRCFIIVDINNQRADQH
jgi:hypothetical protein